MLKRLGKMENWYTFLRILFILILLGYMTKYQIIKNRFLSGLTPVNSKKCGPKAPTNKGRLIGSEGESGYKIAQH